MTRVEIVKRLKKSLSHNLAQFKIYEVPNGWGTRLSLVENEPEGFWFIKGDPDLEGWHLLWEGNAYDFAKEKPTLITRCWFPGEEPEIEKISAEDFVVTRRIHRNYRNRKLSKESILNILNTPRVYSCGE